MQENKASFHVKNISLFKRQMLNWANQFSICCFLDSHSYEDKYHLFDCLLAIDSVGTFCPEENILSQLNDFYLNSDGWIFGHVGYDLKNEIEDLTSTHVNKIGFPDIFFFLPRIVISLNDHVATIFSVDCDPEAIFNFIENSSFQHRSFQAEWKEIKSSFSREDYTKTIDRLKTHILRGDCYEINFCQEFYIDEIDINAVQTYLHLLEISPSPFSCFYKLKNRYLLCASPERYLSKRDDVIFSQPIKGTAARNADRELDALAKKTLYNSEKEKGENVMVVDLVRNDLSKICEEGSVEVDELFGIYSFPQVHQMISTVKGRLSRDISFDKILKATFPMGSMTGAPKRRVMELIDQYERTQRQLYSGSVGYITPDKNFDFNVVIRSIFYNETRRYLNYLVGSAITYYSQPEEEYEECLLKAKAIEAVLM